MFKEGAGGIGNPRPFSDVDLKWATASPEELQSVFEEFAKNSIYTPLIGGESKIYPGHACIVSDFGIHVCRQYFTKGEEPGAFNLSDYAKFEKRELVGGRFIYVPLEVMKEIEGIRDGIGFDRIGRGPFHDVHNAYIGRQTGRVDLSVDIENNTGHIDGIWGWHKENGRYSGKFDFARVAEREPIEAQLDFGTRTITTGQNSVEATYSEKENGERVVILNVVQKGESIGTITIPVTTDTEKVKEKLFPKLDFSDPFNVHPNADSSWLEADLLKAVGIVYNLRSR